MASPPARVLQLLRCSLFLSLLPWCWPSPPLLSVSWTSYWQSWSHCRCSRPSQSALRPLRTRTPAWAHRRWPRQPDLQGSLSGFSPQEGRLLPGRGCCRRSWRTPGPGLRSAESRVQVHRLKVSLRQEGAVLDWHPGWLLKVNRDPKQVL